MASVNTGAMPHRLRIAVVGLGGIAQTAHLPLLRRRWDLAQVVAIADLSACRCAQVGEAYGVSAEHQHADLTSLLEREQVDGVVLLPADESQLAFANLLPAPDDVDAAVLADVVARTERVVDVIGSRQQ